jgi:thioredoxin 1
MQPLMNVARFFGAFNFPTPAQPDQAMRYFLALTALRPVPPHGTGRAYSLGMLNKSEKSNTTNDGLVVITALDFKAAVLESQQPVLVGFWTPWSRPCQVFDSVLQEVAAACGGKVKVVKVNADDSLDLSLWCDIQSVPTLLFFLQGNPCLRIVGTASKAAILARLKAVAGLTL